MWRTFEIQILGWEEPEVVAEGGGQFKQKSKLLLQNMLIIGGRANHQKKSAKYGVGDLSFLRLAATSFCI